jgi:hypothetical protein
MKFRRVVTELFHACGRPGGRTGVRTDGHHEANNHSLQFCERAYKRFQRHPNSQTSTYTSANLTPMPRKSVGYNGEKIVARDEEDFSVDFICIF